MNDSGNPYGLPFLPSFIQSIPVAKHNWQQKLTPHYKPFIETLPVPFVDKLITPSFAIIAVAAFCGHT